MSRRKHSPIVHKFVGPSEILAAIEEISTAAVREHVDLVLVGGAAMQTYGSPRLTSDIDFVATKALRAFPEGPELTFGGYAIKTSNGVPVDLIVRSDRYRKLYDAIFDHARRDRRLGVRVATPEILVPVKLASGRPKDLEDLAFLVTEPDLVDRKKVNALTNRYLGLYAVDDLERFIEEAEWRKKTELGRKGGR